MKSNLILIVLLTALVIGVLMFLKGFPASLSKRVNRGGAISINHKLRP